MHNKFSVIDDDVVCTGSFNYTPAADQDNNENLVIIHSKALAGEYFADFQGIWDVANEP